MNKNLLKTLGWIVPALGLAVFSCKESFLDQPQKGSLGDQQVLSQKGAEQALIGAYSALKSTQGTWSASNTNWVFGSIIGGDAHKGSNAGDQADINPIASFTATATNNYFNDKWRSVYDGIGRTNATLKIINKLAESDISEADKKRITAEARFLRGFYHFEAKRMWNQVPYVDETVDYAAGNYLVSNDKDIWPNIEADFKFAYDNLEPSGMEIGRANKYAAAAFMGKVLLYQKKYAEAKPYFDEVITSGTNPAGTKYGLNDRFWDNFDAATDNSKESVFAIQASVNDGSGAANANPDQQLNFPYNGGPGGCCGFFQPSFELANSYRTDANGIPLLDASYNSGNNEVKSDQGVASDASFTPDQGNLDPRIDWTIGRRGIPYLDWGNHPGTSWVRDQSNGGPFSPKKNVYPKSEEGKLTDGSSWTKGLTATNYQIIRFADVLLMAAECEVELNNLPQALTYVNQVRARAARTDSWVKVSTDPKQSDWDAYLNNNGRGAANYVIRPYTSFPDQNYARRAVHFERKLELAMEGHRFFDLVRWGETTNQNPNGNPVNLQSYLDYEGTKLTIYKGVTFTPGKNEYYPIPQRQLDLMNSGGTEVLKQNPNY